MLDQGASLRKNLLSMKLCKASIHDIATEEQLEKAYKFTAYNCNHVVENIEGKDLN